MSSVEALRAVVAVLVIVVAASWWAIHRQQHTIDVLADSWLAAVCQDDIARGDKSSWACRELVDSLR